MIKFGADKWIPFIVHFVSGKCLDVWTQRTLVHQVLSLFDLDIDLSLSDFGPLCVSAAEAFVQIRMARFVTQLSGNVEIRFTRLRPRSHEFSQVQMRIL